MRDPVEGGPMTGEAPEAAGDATAADAAAAAAAAAERSTCAWKCRQVGRLQFLAVFFVCVALKQVISPSIPYITNTFFAAQHGGGDCSATPGSKPCREGAVDTAYFNSILEGCSHVAAMLMAILLGSCSDRVGRLPVLRMGAVLSALVFSALAMHVVFAWSLWIYLIGNALIESFDVNGVFISLLLDIEQLIPDEGERNAAAGMFCIVFVPLIICCMIAGFLANSEYAMFVSLAAAFVQVIYMFTLFPETVTKVAKSGRRATGLRIVLRDVKRVFMRSAVIRRMALVIALYGCAVGASGVILPPFMTGRLGIKRADKLKILLVAFPIALAAWASWQRVLNQIGPVRVLQISLLASGLAHAVLLLCKTLRHLMVVAVLFVGPIAWGFPTMVKIKSSLVAEDEQGTAQGSTAGISKGSAFLGIVLMGQLFMYSTGGGADLRQGVVLPFLVDAGAYLAAFLVSLALPAALPPKPTAARTSQRTDTSSSEDFLMVYSDTDSSSTTDSSSA